jgi:predicted transposase/invertase (TIGR01784 family)
MKINKKNDYAFKRIFGHEDTKDILAGFLTSVLGVPIKPKELVLIHTELSPRYLADKASVLDIQVRRSKFHEKMNVEIQRADKGNIERRILHYWGRSYTEELKEQQDYASLPRQISIVIVDFDVFEWEDGAKFHGIFRILEREERVQFSDALEIHTIELPKLRRQPLKEDWTSLECWGLYLDNMEGEIMEQIAQQEPLIRRALTVEDVFTKNEEERAFYELREKGRHDYDNAMITAEKRGIKKGKLAGIKEGIKEGRRETARKLLSRQFQLEEISDLTGLSQEEVQSLRNEIDASPAEA